MAAEPEITAFPSSLTAGTSLRFQRSYSSYPASSGWTYNFYLAGASVLTVAGVASAADFIITLAPSDTAGFAPGTYRYTEIVSKDSVKVEMGRGILVIEMNLATATAGTAQTHEEKTLSIIEAALSGRLTKDIESYQIAGRAVSKIPIAELMKLRGTYKAIVAQQSNPSNPIGSIQVTFPHINTSGFLNIPYGFGGDFL